MADGLYLAIAGVAGDGDAGAHYGIAIDSFSWGADEPIATGGGAVGRASLSDLLVYVTDETALAALRSAYASGTSFGGATLYRQATDPASQARYDALSLALGTTTVSSLIQTNSGYYATLHYTDAQVTTRTAATATPTSAGFSTASGTAVTVAPTTGSGTAAAITAPVAYYLVMADTTKYAGDAGSPYTGGYLLNGFSNATALGVTAGDLTLGLATDSDAPIFLGELARGLHASGATVVGVDGSGREVYRLSMSNVVVTGASNLQIPGGSADGELPEQSVRLHYANSTLSTATGAVVGTGAVQVDPDGKTFFIKISGQTGNTNAPDHPGEYEVRGYDLSANLPIGPTGQTAGKATYSDVTVTFADRASLVAVLGDVAAGRHIQSVTLSGDNIAANGLTYVESSLTLGDVLVTSVDGGGDGGGYAATLSYTTLTATETSQTGRVETATYNRTTNVASDSSTQGSFSGQALPPTPPATAPGQAVAYYLVLDDGSVAGETGAPYAHGFALETFSYGVTSGAPAGGAGGGAGAASYSPVSATLVSDAGYADLLALLASGRHVADAHVYGVDASGRQVYDLALSDAVVSQISEQPTVNMGVGVGATLALTAASQTLTTSVGGTQVGFGTTAQAPTEQTFLKIAGLTGTSGDALHPGEIRVDNASLSASAIANGGASIDDVSIDVSDDSALTALLGYVTGGQHIPTVTLSGEAIAADGTHYDAEQLALRNAQVTNISVNAGGGYSVDLHFDTLTQSTWADGPGTTGRTVTYDTVRNLVTSGATAGTAPVASGTDTPDTPAVGDAVRYVLAIAGLTPAAGLALSAFGTSVGSEGGQVSYTELDVTLAGGEDQLPALTDALTHGRFYSGAHVLGYDAYGDQVYDLALSNVALSDLSDDASGSPALTLVPRSFTVSATVGPQAPRHLVGTTGPDTLTGAAGADTLDGLAGDDILDGAGGADTMTGGTGNDTYYVDDAGDQVIEAANGGTDTVHASVTYGLTPNVEIGILDGTAAISLFGNGLANTLTGNAAANVLDGKAGADTMTGGDGNDTYYVDNTGDMVVEAAGQGAADIVHSLVSYTLPDNVERLILDGTAAINATGNALANVLIGNAAANILDGRAGADAMQGGAGNDVYYVDNAGDQVIEAAGGGTDTVHATVSYTLGSNVENLILDNAGGAINGIGNALDNTITGNNYVNTLVGGAGADVMAGGGSNDTYYVDNVGDVVIEGANAGTDLIHTTVSYTMPDNVERMILDGTDNINGYGNAGFNVITGNAGNNILDGKGGADAMAGGLGDDTYYVDNVGDVASEAANGGNDTVHATVSFTLTGYVETLILDGTADLNGTGNAIANTLIGNAGNNALNGSFGADTMIGGAGNDNYYVDNTGDVVVENANEGLDLVHATISYTLGANVERLVLDGTAAINGTGNALANVVIGNSGANVLDGKGGLDNLTGGAGHDVFLFDTAPGASNVATITDFAVADDLIRLDRGVFAALGPDGALAASAFWTGAAAHDADDRILYDAGTGNLYYDPDGTGGTAAVQFAHITAHLSLTNAQFDIVG